MYYPAQTHVSPLVTLRRVRLLPAPGEILVGINQHVEAADVIGRVTLPIEHHLLDVAHALRVSPAAADRLVLRRDGERVKKGEVIAIRRGLRRRQVRSPVSGTLIASGGGRVLIAASGKPLELRAGMPGTVVGLTEGLGVTIEATGALVQGVWGSGGQDLAVLRLLGETRDTPLTADLLDVGRERGAIVVAGLDADEAALRKAAEIRVRGMVLASLSSDLIGLARRLPFPVMITEGFGRRPMAEPVFTLLRTSAGREAALDARPADRFEGWRPELVIPLPAQLQSPPTPAEGLPLAAGRRVRVLRALHGGAVGKVQRLLPRPQKLPGGVRSLVAQVELEGGLGSTLEAFANLEILD